MRYPVLFSLLLSLLLASCASKNTLDINLPGQGRDKGKTIVYRDSWGVPHIYAPTAEAGLFAQGYAQAEDRPEQLLINILVALGELSSIAGTEQVNQDLLSKMFDHHGNARRFLASLTETQRAPIDAFTAGINYFYARHPEKIPVWWQGRTLTSAMIDAFGRLFLYNWSIDEALSDLKKGGVEPDFFVAQRASNQWAVSPQRSANGHAMLMIDPHLSWWGSSRFWEMRIHAGNLHGSGVGLVGSPYIGLGHNNNIAWAMTTGGPDTADIYRLTLNPDNSNEYRYEGEWRKLKTKSVQLQIRGEGKKDYQLEFSHHGPVVARDGNYAYVAKIPYDGTTDRNAAWLALNIAQDYAGAIKATETLAMFPQNIMVADTQGNIYYQRTGRVPVRDQKFDWSKPVDGSIAATEWKGIHPASDHVQLLNPEAGYMQNCNIPPDAMLINSPLKLEDYPDYLYSSAIYGPTLSGWTAQRGARALALLEANDRVSVEDMLNYAVDITPYGVERWLEALAMSVDVDNKFAREVLSWNGELHRNSTAALKYSFWRLALADHAGGLEVAAAVDDYYALPAARLAKTVQLSASMKAIVRKTFNIAMKSLSEGVGIEAKYGDVFRVGRDDKSWPIGGGGQKSAGLKTLRAMGYEKPDQAGQRRGFRGQTSTQVVELSIPIKSWIYLPVGQSDDPDSPHYDDQAEKLYQQRKLKPSWWLPEDLMGHIESRTVLDFIAK